MKKNKIITTVLLSASFLLVSSLTLSPGIIGHIFKDSAFPNGESPTVLSLKSTSEFDSTSELKSYSGSSDDIRYPSELSPDNDPLVSRSLGESRRSRTQNTSEAENAKNAQKNESIRINQNSTAAKASEASQPVETAKPAYEAKPATTVKPATASKPAAAKPSVAKPVVSKPSNTQSTSSYSASDIDLLARLITAEAQGEPYSAQVGVGAVILNRIQSKEFPNTIPGVIYQTINGYTQFTPVVNGWINKPALPGCINAAKEALNGADPTNGALFYYDNTTTNQWILSKPISTQIGTMVYAY